MIVNVINFTIHENEWVKYGMVVEYYKKESEVAEDIRETRSGL